MSVAGNVLFNRVNLRESRIATAPAPTLQQGQVLCAVRRIALTANNVTYAVAGDTIGYWKFFPAEDGWGLPPVWGFVDIADGRLDGLAPGERIWGYWPLGTHVVLHPGKLGVRGFADVAPHRAGLPGFYNLYRRGEQLGVRGECIAALLRPLFATSFLLDEHLAQNAMFGAGQVLIGSASSKTGIGLAFLSRARGAARVVGLTSERNRAFCMSLGCYDAVRTYAEIEDPQDVEPAVFVDMAGDGGVTDRVHRAWGDALKASIQVGLTHWDAQRAPPPAIGPRPAFFFAPTSGEKLLAALGAAEFDRRLQEAQARFHAFADTWLAIEEHPGLEGAKAAWERMANGDMDPAKGVILTF
jgi:hypothetical protein